MSKLHITAPTNESERQAKAFQQKVQQHGSLTFVPVSQGIVDIFQGTGWGGHSRYRNYKGKWFWIAGKKLDTSMFPGTA